MATLKTPAKTKKHLTAKKADKSAKLKAGDREVTIDRRRNERRDASPADEHPALQRRAKVNRRRQIDPTTCERDYSVDEVEFMRAIDEYKRRSGRMFPTCSEVLEVIRALGYIKLDAPAETTDAPTDAAPALAAASEDASASALEESAI